MSHRSRIFIPLGLIVMLLPLWAAVEAHPVSGQDTESITGKVFPSVVKVEARNLTRRVATGVVVGQGGYIVTTALISPRDGEIFIRTSEGKRSEAKFLGMDPETHLALIQAEDKDLPPIDAAKPGTLSPGSWIAVVSVSPEDTPAFTQGYVSSVAPDRVRLNVWVGPGMSGSPVVDREGRMVGLLRGVYVDEQPIVFQFMEREVVGSGYVFSRAEAPASGMAVAVPVDVVESVAEEIKRKGKVPRGWLGVSIALNEEDKVEIMRVEEDSPAELADLRKGDIVLEFDGEEVRDTEQLARMIRRKSPGETVVLEVERKGKVKEVKVRLGEYSEEDVWKDFERKFPRLFRSRPFETPRAFPDVFRRSFGKRKYIGIYPQEMNRELAAYFGVDEGTGLLVTRVEKDSPAERASLRAGDVIVRADGRRVEKTRELSKLIGEKEEGEKITIEFLRDKKKKSVEVEVEEEEGSLFRYPGEARVYRKVIRDTAGRAADALAAAPGSLGRYAQDYLREQLEDWEAVTEEWKNRLKKQQRETERLYEEALKVFRTAGKRAEIIV